MPSFIFNARDAGGHSQAGTLAAASAAQAVSDLRGRGWIVLDVRQGRRSWPGLGQLAEWLNPRYWIPPTRLDVEMGLQQLATMIRSGLNLLSALRTAAEQARRPRMARVWTRVADRIIEGSSFADALAAEGHRFSPLVIELVRVGEASGSLDTVLTRASEHLERSRATRAVLVTALLYPAFVLAAASGVTIFMMVSVIPKIGKFIAGRGRSLPAITQALLDCTAWLHNYGAVLAVVMVAVMATVYLTYRSAAGRRVMDRLALRVPVIGTLLRLAGTASLARGLGLLLENSITLLDALEIVRSLVANRAMRQRVEVARQAVMDGRSFADALRTGREFLPMLPQMVSVGEATGRLDLVLSEVADYHDKQVAVAVRRFSIFIEPAVILIVGAIVGFVYMAFFLALFSVGGSIR